MTRQNVIANNLANVSSSGFQRQLAVFEASPPVGGPMAGAVALESGACVSAVVTDPSPGAVIQTGAPLDVAIEGPGYFVVQTARGLAYTRDGGFHLGPGGRLETAAGDPVLGQRGEVVVGARQVTIGEEGTLFADGQPVDRLQVVAAPGGAGVPARLRLGCREGSNVNPVREMAAMIAGFRTYEANQRAIQMQDRTLEIAAGEVARI